MSRAAARQPRSAMTAMIQNGAKNQAICFVASAMPSGTAAHLRSRYIHAMTRGSA
jgi:hypothetical protein